MAPRRTPALPARRRRITVALQVSAHGVGSRSNRGPYRLWRRQLALRRMHQSQLKDLPGALMPAVRPRSFPSTDPVIDARWRIMAYRWRRFDSGVGAIQLLAAATTDSIASIT